MDLPYLDFVMDWNQNIQFIIITRQGLMSSGFADCKMLDVHGPGSWPQLLLHGSSHHFAVYVKSLTSECWDSNKEPPVGANLAFSHLFHRTR